MAIPLQIDPVLAESILLQYYREGVYTTDEQEKIALVGLLRDRGYIQEKPEYDANDKIVAVTITDMKQRGRDRIKEYYASFSNLTESGPCSPQTAVSLQDERIYKSDEEIRRVAAKAYDTYVWRIAYGGLGVALTTLSLIFIENGPDLKEKIDARLLVPCGLAILCWTFNIGLMLWLERRVISQTTSRKEKNEQLSADAKEENAKITTTEGWNVLNGFAAVAGILSFGGFILWTLYEIIK